MTSDAQTLARASRLVRTLAEVEHAYITDGWLSVGLLLSGIDRVEVHEVADWVAQYARDLEVRDGSIDGARDEVGRGTDGQSSSTSTLPPPLRHDSAQVDPPLAVAAESTVPYDWETEGFGGT